MAYRVKTVTQLTGIPRNTLVAWERRYGLLSPDRTSGGYRLYTEDDVRYLRQLKALVDEGVAISEAISRLKPESGSTLLDDLLVPLLAFDRAGAEPALRRVRALPFREAVRTTWLPLLAEIGTRWEAGTITVAQEHYAAGVAREHLLSMLNSVGPGRAPHAVLACVPGELHDLPLLVVAVELTLRGWFVTWLGADLPIGDLCACVMARRPDVVGLSSVVATGDVYEAARQVRACGGAAVVVAVGGPGGAGGKKPRDPSIWTCADADELARRWAEHAAR